MAVLVFLLSLVLLAAGLASGYTSLDLLPTIMGLVYACAGVVAIVAAVIVFALGVVAVRLGRLSRTVREQAAALASLSALAPALAEAAAEFEPAPAAVEDAAPLEPVEEAAGFEPFAEAEPAFRAEEPTGESLAGEVEAGMAAPERSETPETSEEVEEPLNENRAGRLPTFAAIERAIETPETPPTLIGRYASGGANYMIFSDGSIEAETDEGAFKFASMGAFKKFLLDRNAGKA
jgi:hypothetical protein